MGPLGRGHCRRCLCEVKCPFAEEALSGSHTGQDVTDTFLLHCTKKMLLIEEFWVMIVSFANSGEGTPEFGLRIFSEGN